MSLAQLLAEPDRLAFLLLVLLVAAAVGVGAWAARREPPASEDRVATEPVTTWPYLVRLELLATLAVLLVFAWWAILLEPPLGAQADPAVTPSVAKAPWFFVGVQELLQYFDPWLAGAVLPLLGLFGLAALPYLDRVPEGAGRYRLRPAALLALLALLGLWLVPSGVGLLLRGENWSLAPVWRIAPPLDEPVHAPLASLADRLRLGPIGGQLLGASLCLGPLLLLLALWPRTRRRFGRLGLFRYLLAGALLLVLAGVGLKVLLVLGLDIRYLWVTPWFRI